MRAVTPIAEMLAALAPLRACPAHYVAHWRGCLAEIGLRVAMGRKPDGEDFVMIGGPCDPQMRHRNRWLHFLCEDLGADDGPLRTHLRASLLKDGYVVRYGAGVADEQVPA